MTEITYALQSDLLLIAAVHADQPFQQINQSSATAVVPSRHSMQ